MDGLNNTCFQSVVILGLKTALLEAQDEINRIRKERDEARKKLLQLIQANSKFQVEVINSNQLATKLKSMLKKLRNEFEEHKKEMTDKEHNNVNLEFKVKELKSLLDIKTELLESLNIKGDRVNRDELIDYRANYKTLMRNLKLVIKNQPYFPDNQLLEDIQDVISKTERGKPANLSKYLVKKTKSDREESNTCDDDGKSTEIGEYFENKTSPSMALSNCFKNGNDKCAEKIYLNTVLNDCSMKEEDLSFLNDDLPSKTNLVAEKTIKICEEPVINVDITNMPQLQIEERINIDSSTQKNEKDGTMSDSESDKTSGFCDIETEVESPPSVESSSHTRNTPSPENHTLAMCMPDLLLSVSNEKSTQKIACDSSKKVIEKNTTCKSPISSNSKIVKDDGELPTPKKKNADLINARKVQNILEEMNTMKNTMICQVSSLEQFHDDTMVESNSCFKRPKSLRSSHRESVRKNRNNTENTANFIPRRSSQLVKRDPCSRNKIVEQTSHNKLDKKPDLSISEVNDTKTKSIGKSNLTRETSNSACNTGAIENCEKFSVENSSSPREVTSCFEKPIENTTQSLPQLISKTEISNIIDAKDTSNEPDLSESDDEVAAEKSESPQISQNLLDDINVPVDDEPTNELKNSHMESTPCIEDVAVASDANERIAVEEQDDLSNKENNSVFDARVDNVLSEKNSSSIDEKPSLILTKENENSPEVYFDSLLSKKAPLDVDENAYDISVVENKYTSEASLDMTPSKNITSDIEKKPTSQSTESSTSKQKEATVVSKSSNELTVPENITTEEKVSEEDVPKKRKSERLKKVLLVTKSESGSTSISTFSAAEPSAKSKTTRRTSTQSKTTAAESNTEPTVVNLQPSNTMNNGMERRKRKGKFNEILDSLKSKSKRRKTDFHPESPELTKDVKPLQRRGRKRKTSLPVETWESATQTNWSPHSESLVSQITDGISELEEISVESETKSEASLKNAKSKQQIDDQTSSATNKKNSYSSDEIPVVVENVDFVTQLEKRPTSSVSESCNFVSVSFLGQLIDMTKIIQDKVSTVFESQRKLVAAAKIETCSSLEKENMTDAPSRATNQTESFLISKSESKLDRISSPEPEKYTKQITESSIETSCQLPTTPEEKLKQERVPNSSDSSSEPEKDAGSCKKSTIPTAESLSVVNLKPDRNPNSPTSSLEMEKDKESIPKSDIIQIENPEASASDANLKRECVSCLAFELENDEHVTSSKTEMTCKTNVVASSDLKRRHLPYSSYSSYSSSEVENDDDEIKISSSTEKTCKTKVTFSSNLTYSMPNPSSSELEIDRSTAKSSISNANQTETTPFGKLERNVALNSTSKGRNIREPIKRSIFDSEDDVSPIEISSKKVSLATRLLFDCEEVQEKCSVTSSWNNDSEDDPPTEVPLKQITAVEKCSPDSNNISSPTTMKKFDVELLTNRSTNDAEPETATRVRYAEEFSNSSGTSSRESELDANIEMISQFENVRTPPKVKDLFDSTDDDENSHTEVFSILEEMASASLRLSQKKHELNEFSRRLSPTLPFEPTLAPPIIPSLTKYQMYESPERILDNESEIKDDDDSEDEMLIIAEDHQTNENSGGGIEINKFNCHDTNYSYAFTAYTNSLTPSSTAFNGPSNATATRDQTFTNQTPKKKIENGNQASKNNTIKFEFYKETMRMRTEKDDGTVKPLSPFESIWENLKLLHVRNRVKEEDTLLPCCNSVPQLAFFYRIRKTDTKDLRVSVDQNEAAGVEKLLNKYLVNVRRSQYVAVKDFKLSVNSNSATIAEALISTILKIANRDLKELKDLLEDLANLCVDLETDHKDFITEMQTTLRDQIFAGSWSMDRNSGAGQVTCTISMSIIFTMLSQRSNNLKTVKDLLLEALCSFKYKAHPIAFGVLNAWPAVFNDASRNCLLTRIILFSLLNHSMDRNLKLYKVIEVREMIGQHYNVKLGDKTAEDHAKESMLLFDDDTWVDAVVLLCKRKLFPWSYTNVIAKYLIQIVDRWKEHNFNEMIVIKTVQALHKILLSCPMKAVRDSNIVKEKPSVVPTKQLTYNIIPIIETLSNVLQCAKGSRELRETVVIAICGISHLNFEFCSEILSKWDPPEGVISNKTLEEMHLIMHRYRSYKPNPWLRVILPKDQRPKPVANRRNLVPCKPNGDFSKQKQHPVRGNFFTSSKVEPPRKKKKKKKKSKRNQRNPE